jgi:hypothetical protein
MWLIMVYKYHEKPCMCVNYPIIMIYVFCNKLLSFQTSAPSHLRIRQIIDKNTWFEDIGFSMVLYNIIYLMSASCHFQRQTVWMDPRKFDLCSLRKISNHILYIVDHTHLQIILDTRITWISMLVHDKNIVGEILSLTYTVTLIWNSILDSRILLITTSSSPKIYGIANDNPCTSNSIIRAHNAFESSFYRA